jgi:hypothetical protein
MANPFLVLGGVVLGVVTAGIGVLQVPGWIDSANDSAVIGDLGQIAIAQEAALTMTGDYATLGELEAGANADGSFGIKVQQSDGPLTYVAVNGDRWAAVSISKSGYGFIRTSDSTKVFKTDAKIADGDTLALTMWEVEGDLPADFPTNIAFTRAAIVGNGDAENPEFPAVTGTKAAPFITIP